MDEGWGAYRPRVCQIEVNTMRGRMGRDLCRNMAMLQDVEVRSHKLRDLDLLNCSQLASLRTDTSTAWKVWAFFNPTPQPAPNSHWHIALSKATRRGE